jgi:uncharacterized protein (TIGR03435 family)
LIWLQTGGLGAPRTDYGRHRLSGQRDSAQHFARVRLRGSRLERRLSSIWRAALTSKTNRGFMQNPQAFRRTFLLAIGAVGAVSALRAQAPAPDSKPAAFDVATIKPHKPGDHASSSFVQPGGRYTATNVTLRMLMRTAYEAHEDQVIGGPNWTSSERFDIVGKAEGNRPTTTFRDQARLMLRQLLADRFKLALHHEIRDISIYALVIARRDGKLGPQLRPSNAADCTATKAPNPSASTAPNPDTPGFIQFDSLPCRAGFSREGHVAARTIIFSAFVTGLSNWTDRLVFDHTGLAGTFDWDLQWMPESLAPDLPNAVNDRPSDAGISLFTAVKEQLGLKLEPTKGPVDVLVIDHVEQPTPD